MVGQIQRNDGDLAVAGYSWTSERNEVVMFSSVLTIPSPSDVFIRKPTISDVSTAAYLSEFHPSAWTGIGVSIAVMGCVLFVHFVLRYIKM